MAGKLPDDLEFERPQLPADLEFEGAPTNPSGDTTKKAGDGRALGAYLWSTANNLGLGLGPTAMASEDALDAINQESNRPLTPVKDDVGAITRGGNLLDKAAMGVVNTAASPVESFEKGTEAYRARKPVYDYESNRLAEEHPIATGMGDLTAGALQLAVNPTAAPANLVKGAVRARPLLGVLKKMAGPAIEQAFTAWNMTPGTTAGEGHVEAAGKNALGGGAFGALSALAPGVAALGGLGLAALGDKVGLTDSERLRMVPSSLAGVTSSVANKIGSKFKAGADAALGEAVEPLKADITRAQTDTEIANAVKTKAQLADIRAKEKAHAQAVKEANAPYQADLLALGKKKAAESKASDIQDRRIAKVKKALEAIAKEEQDLEKSVRAKKANTHGTQINRIANTKTLGLEVPEEAKANVQKILDTYGENSPELLNIDPDKHAADWGARESEGLKERRARLEADLRKLEKRRASEIAEHVRRKNNPLSFVTLDEAKALAEKWGLIPADSPEMPFTLDKLLVKRNPGPAKETPKNPALMRANRGAEDAAANEATLRAALEDLMTGNQAGKDKLAKIKKKAALGSPTGFVTRGEISAARAAIDDPVLREAMMRRYDRALSNDPRRSAYAVGDSVASGFADLGSEAGTGFEQWMDDQANAGMSKVKSYAKDKLRAAIEEILKEEAARKSQ